MKPMKKTLVILFVAALLMLTVRLSPAQQPENQPITEAVEDELKSDFAVQAENISVTARSGTVMLSGIVDNLLAKERAAKIAETVKGVVFVDNRLEVRPEEVPDNMILNNITEAIAVNPATESYKIRIGVNKGIVNLSGTVDSFQEKELAGKLAKRVKGVRGINNLIAVAPKQDRPEAEIKADIQQALRWDALVADAQINVSVKNKEVFLSGTVPSAAEKSRAINRAYVAGVNSIYATALKVVGSDRSEEFKGTKFSAKADDQIEKAVEREMLFDPLVKSVYVNTSVEDGVVTLRGKVDSLQAKRAAADDARTVVGVKRVKNRLNVEPPGDLTDTVISRSIARALAADPYVSTPGMTVTVENGIANITGYAESFFEKAHADYVVSGVKGVREVRNNLYVELSPPLTYDPYVSDFYYYDLDWHNFRPFPTAKSDVDIREDIKNELFWSPFVDAEEVNVIVDNGVATLTGTVDSLAESEAAIENAIEGGAFRVINKLEVRG